MKSRQTILGVIIILVVLVALLFGWKRSFFGRENVLPVHVSFVCNEDKTIEADLYEGAIVPPKKEGDMPTLTGKAHVELSDGRKLDLVQTLSADGTRYANKDESFVFWAKGNGAIVLENKQEKSYVGCVAVQDKTDQLSGVYHDKDGGFSILLPQGFTPDASYAYTGMGQGKEIYGVKFTVPESYATGTNLASDSYISVEQKQGGVCKANMFLEGATNVSTTTENNIVYSVATSTGAAAGNRYEEHVYAIPGTNPCVAVRYMIHYGVIENYPKGAVKEFDEKKLLSTFDAIRKSLVINQ